MFTGDDGGGAADRTPRLLGDQPRGRPDPAPAPARPLGRPLGRRLALLRYCGLRTGQVRELIFHYVRDGHASRSCRRSPTASADGATCTNRRPSTSAPEWTGTGWFARYLEAFPRAARAVTSGAGESILGEFTMIVRIDLDGHEVGARDDLHREREAGSAMRVGAVTLGARSPARNDVGRPE